MSNNILLVEDQKFIREQLSELLKEYGFISPVSNKKDALEAIQNNNFQVAIIDLTLDKKCHALDGIDIIRESVKKNIIPVVLSSHESPEIIEKSFEAGCQYYYSKKDFKENINKYIEHILNIDSNEITDFLKNEYITKNKTLLEEIHSLKNIAKFFKQNIFISGETGVGKSKISHLIHKIYDSQCPFVHINLSELSSNIIESELFGYKKGAFTGATNDKTGLIEKAHNGILFLDEIGSINTEIQKKLLKTLENKVIIPVGSNEEIKVNFKLITATCDDLFKKITDGSFRTDFYYRIHGVEIHIPPLSKRKEDIVPLIDFMISQSTKKITLNNDVKELLLNYRWYGNIRELENIVKNLISNANGIVTKDELPQNIINNISPFIKSTSQGDLLSNDQKSLINSIGLPEFINKIEKESFKKAYDINKGKVNTIVKKLNISKTVFYRLKENLNKNFDNSTH